MGTSHDQPTAVRGQQSRFQSVQLLIDTQLDEVLYVAGNGSCIPFLAENRIKNGWKEVLQEICSFTRKVDNTNSNYNASAC